jgi:hypothetical protein
MLRNGIPRVCFYFFSMERNSEHFCPLRNGSERNSESFLFRGMVQSEIPRVCFCFCSIVQNWGAFFSSAERFGTEFREFYVSRNGRNSAGTNQLFRLFRLPRNTFFVGNCQPYSRPCKQNLLARRDKNEKVRGQTDIFLVFLF